MRILSAGVALAILAAVVAPGTLPAQVATPKQAVTPPLGTPLIPNGSVAAKSRHEQVQERIRRCGGRGDSCSTFASRKPGGDQIQIKGLAKPQIKGGEKKSGGLDTTQPKGPFRQLIKKGQDKPGSVEASPRSPVTHDFLIKIGGSPIFKKGGISEPQASANAVTANEAALAPRDPAYLAVAITYGDDRLCTGVVVGPFHVLTAGHCACGEPSTYKVIFGDDARISDRAHELAQPPILFDQRSCPETGDPLFGKDLALLVLKTTFTCGKIARLHAAVPTPGIDQKSRARNVPVPITVPDCDVATSLPVTGSSRSTFGYPGELFGQLDQQLTVGQKLLVVGYGYVDDVQLGDRAQGFIPIRSAACTERSLDRFCQPFTEMILAEGSGPRSDTDSCRGDSGGPVFLTTGNGYTLVGITSRAAPAAQSSSAAHCGGGGIYTIVGRHSVIDWLSANGVNAAETIALAPLASN